MMLPLKLPSFGPNSGTGSGPLWRRHGRAMSELSSFTKGGQEALRIDRGFIP
jgi:hypothetical protein